MNRYSIYTDTERTSKTGATRREELSFVVEAHSAEDALTLFRTNRPGYDVSSIRCLPPREAV